MLQNLLRMVEDEMTLKDELTQLELGFWEASTDPSYYQAHMSGRGFAVFADMILNKADAIAATNSNEAAGWSNVRLERVNLMPLGPDVAALVYTGHAEREGTPYAANVISTYERGDAGWELVLHQQSVNAG